MRSNYADKNKLWFILLLMIGNLGELAAQPAEQGAKQKPNIVIIMADDLDSKQLSCYGGQNLKTHHIDQLAEIGMRFTNMIASEAMCVPTRASLFTGLYPARHGAYQNHKDVYPEIKSVCHYLGESGYRVGLTGKRHVTKPFPFDIIPGFEPNSVKRKDDYFLDSIERYILEPEPFCLFVMSINPHVPWTVGDPSEFDSDKLVLPASWVDTKLTRQRFAEFLAEVRRLDNQVGDVMKMLERNRLLDNTIVIFLGEQGAQFPGAKWTLWDEGQRGSMIVRWPGVVEQGSVSDALVQYEDIVPTLIDIVGGRSTTDLDGISFEKVLVQGSSGNRDYAYGIHNNIPAGTAYPIRSIRDQNFKLIWNLLPENDFYVRAMMNPVAKGSYYNNWVEKAKWDKDAARIVQRFVKRPEFELYDLRADPNEFNNLVEKPAYKKQLLAYKTQLETWMKQQGDTGAEMDVKLD